MISDDVKAQSEETSNRPTLTVTNANGYMTGIIAQYNGLMNAGLARYSLYH